MKTAASSRPTSELASTTLAGGRASPVARSGHAASDRAPRPLDESTGQRLAVKIDGRATRITIQSEILFGEGSHELRPFARTLVAPLFGVLHRSDEPIFVGAHTDDAGPRGDSLALSLRRARSVVEFLADLGIDTRRVKAAGHGPDRPVASNASHVGRALNRRLEIVLPAVGYADRKRAGVSRS